MDTSNVCIINFWYIWYLIVEGYTGFLPSCIICRIGVKPYTPLITQWVPLWPASILHISGLSLLGPSSNYSYNWETTLKHKKLEIKPNWSRGRQTLCVFYIALGTVPIYHDLVHNSIVGGWTLTYGRNRSHLELAQDGILASDNLSILSNLYYKMHRILKLTGFSSRLTFAFVQSTEVRWSANDKGVLGAVPTGNAPTTSEWSASLLSAEVWLILEAWP